MFILFVYLFKNRGQPPAKLALTILLDCLDLDDGDDRVPLISTPLEEHPESVADGGGNTDYMSEMPGLEIKRTSTVPLAKVDIYDSIYGSIDWFFY